MNDTFELAQWARMREEGLTYAQIAARVGKNPSTVWHALVGRVPAVHGRRVREAADLRASGVAWKLIASTCGYKDANSAKAAVIRYNRKCLDRAMSDTFGMQ